MVLTGKVYSICTLDTNGGFRNTSGLLPVRINELGSGLALFFELRRSLTTHFGNLDVMLRHWVWP